MTHPRFVLERGTYNGTYISHLWQVWAFTWLREAGVARATDLKRQHCVVLKFARGDMVEKETRIYDRLEGVPGIPRIFGWCTPGPPLYGFLCMQEYPQDLSQLVLLDSGPIPMGLACMVAGCIVSWGVPAETELTILARPTASSVIQGPFQGHNSSRHQTT